MVTRIYAKGFKGLDFDQPLTARTLITGRVGSGKSARALALALLVTGALPGTGVARKSGDILDAVGSGDTLMVGIELDNGTTLERQFKRGKTGTVKTEFRQDGNVILKDLFGVELAKHGLSVVNVSDFLSMSDAKKVDELFRLFPPQGNVKGLNKQITDAKAELSAIESDSKAKELSVNNLSKAIAELNLPAGNLPEVQAEIVRVQAEYEAARNEYAQEKGRIEAEAKAEADAKAAAEAAKPAPAPVREEPIGLPMEEKHDPAWLGKKDTPAHLEELQANLEWKTEPKPHACQCGGKCKSEAQDAGIAALERVLNALERAGCDGCAAKMVLKRELKNLRAMKETGHE